MMYLDVIKFSSQQELESIAESLKAEKPRKEFLIDKIRILNLLEILEIKPTKMKIPKISTRIPNEYRTTIKDVNLHFKIYYDCATVHRDSYDPSKNLIKHGLHDAPLHTLSIVGLTIGLTIGITKIAGMIIIKILKNK